MSIKQRNYMGVMVVNHYTADEAIECIGAQLPSPSITEIALYEAAKDTETGAVIRGKMLSKVHMSDHQFGTMIGRPNFNYGQLVTLNHIDGFEIESLDSHYDPTKQDLSAEIKNFLGAGDNQVSRFIREMIALSEDVVQKNRLGKNDKKEFQKYLKMLLSYVQANDNFALNEINRVAEDRANEVKSSIHQTIRDAHRIGGKPLLTLEDKSTSSEALPTLSPAGFMAVSVGSSTNMPLFDDVNTDNSVVGIKLSTAEPRASLASTREDDYRSVMELFSVNLSPEQYARFVRADKMEVACTITRRKGETIDKFDKQDTRDVTFSPEAATEAFSDYIEAVKHTMSGLENNEFKGKAGLVQLQESFKVVQQRYERYLEDSAQAKMDATQEVFKEQQQRVSDFFEKEVELLPDNVKGKIAKPLQDLVKKVSLRIEDDRNKK